MRWHLRRKNSDTAPSDTAGQHRADEALDESAQELRKATGEHPVIIREAEKLIDAGRRNNFADLIKEALGGAG